MHVGWRRPFLSVGAMVLIGLLGGCAYSELEYAPKGPYLGYHKQLPAAERAVEAARAAGKDRECPAEFAAAEKLKDDAYQTYWACRTNEAIAMANEATAKVNALCPAKVVAAAPLAPPPPAVPTAAITASPATIQQGQCATLTWSATNATSTAIDQGIGSVVPSGSRQVCPTSTTSYLLTATGAGGSQTASTSVGVPAPPPPAAVPAPPVERQTLHINFDTNKATIRPADVPELQKAVEFAKRYPGRKISIEGHTDNVGNAKYNQGLSERRAAAVKEYLLKNGVSGGERITTVGYGQTKPIADNATANGRFQNRRVELVRQ